MAATAGSSSLSTSRSLLERVRTGDDEAWVRFVDLYGPYVLHWCRRSRLHDHDVADVFQEVFQAVSQSIVRFRKEKQKDTLRGWLRTVTWSKVQDHFRKGGKQPQAGGGSDYQRAMQETPEPPPLPAESPDSRAERQLFWRALEPVREQFRPMTWRAFWRTVIDGQAPKDVAEELNMSPGAVRVAKSRVLQRLRMELGDLIPEEL